jgi:hypothetical protein
MMARLMIAGMCAAALATTSSPLHAQSMTTYTTAKRVATNAAAATDAHTRAMEGGAASASDKPAPAAPAPDTRSTGGAAASGRSSSSTTPASERAPKSEVVVMREVFVYDSEGRRDPFVSLMKSGELRPMVADLRLVAVIYDPVGRSVAIMRDVATQEQYRAKVGQTLGRMRVTQIRPKEVVFTVEEYGFSRQETLVLNDTTRARSQ